MDHKNSELNSMFYIVFGNYGINNPRTVKFDDKYVSVSDYEERCYCDIKPLHLFIKSIDIYPYVRGDRFTKEQIDIIKKLINRFPMWKKYVKIGERGMW